MKPIVSKLVLHGVPVVVSTSAVRAEHDRRRVSHWETAIVANGRTSDGIRRPNRGAAERAHDLTCDLVRGSILVDEQCKLDGEVIAQGAQVWA